MSVAPEGPILASKQQWAHGEVEVWASEKASSSPWVGPLLQVLDGVLQGLATRLWQQGAE